jgi:ATP synthase protein I
MTYYKKTIEKLDALNERAQEIRLRNKIREEEEEQPMSEKDKEAERHGARAGSEFLASVLAGGLIGYGIDSFFGTLPWAMIVFLILGFVSGTYRATKTIKKHKNKNHDHCLKK